MKQLEVQIMGHSYLLSCPENSEPQLFKAVHKVDTAMCKIRDAGKVKARDRIAVLAALNLAFQLLETSTPAPVADVPDAALEAAQAQLEALLHRLDNVLAAEKPKP